MTDPSQPVGLEAELKPSARKVLGMLRAAGGRGVSNGEFIRAYIEHFGGRIHELRKKGWEVLTVREGEGKSRYILQSEPAGVGAGVLGPVASSADSGGHPTARPESDSAALVGMGGRGAGEGALFDPPKAECSAYDPWNEAA